MSKVAIAYQHVLEAIAIKASAAEAEGRTLERSEANLRRDLLLELAAIWRDDLHEPLEAEQAYREILERDETHQAA